jgi:hypothetical protein
MAPTTALAVLLATILTLTGTASAQSMRFRVPISFALDKLPETIAVGDLNRDGHADVVVTHYVEGAVTALLGNGQSSFTSAGEFPLREGPIRAYIADLDDDTRLDLIVSHDESDQVSLLRGNGDGTFAAAQEIEPGHDPVGVAIADLDGDQRLDLIVALSGENNGELAVMRNLGNMQFERTQLLFIAGDCIEVVVHDFDGDGFPDAALSNPIFGSLTRLRGIAGGIFEPAGEIPLGTGPTLLTLADVDADGAPDIIAGLTDVSAVGVLRGREDGTFEALAVYPSGGDALSGMVVADVNGDAVPDVVTSNLRSRNAALLLGRGDGTFADATAVTPGANPVEVGVADFNSDGLADIVSANEGVNSLKPTLNLLHGDGAGRFVAPEQLLAALNPVGVAVGDFDGDAVADAVVGSAELDGVVIFPGARGGLSAASIPVPLDREPEQILGLDVDDDGWTDVLFLGGNDITVLFADGTGELSAPIHLPLPVRCGAFSAADVDGDGDQDLVAAAARAPSAFYLVRNDTGRLFAAAAMIETSVLPSSMAAGDVDADGRGDLITNDRSQNHVFVFPGPGLLASPGLPASAVVSAVAVGDLDANGAADVVAVSPGGRELSTFFNDGSGVLVSAPPQAAGFAIAVMLRDLDGDGYGEAIVADQLSGETSVFRNDRSGGWSALDPLVIGERLTALSAGDFDDDGRYDLIAGGTNVYRLINETEDAGVVRGDGNGDGRVTAADIVAVAAELYDGDSSQVESVSLGTFAGKSGVDADGDGVIARADLRASPLRLF